MPTSTPSRRTIIKAAGATALVPYGAARVLSQAPAAETVTPALVEAAKKEGKLNFYTAMDIAVAQPYCKMFEAAYPGVSVRVERNGSERLFSRIAMEYGNKIHNVDVFNTTDAAHALYWKKQGWLAPFVSADVALHFGAEYKDADGQFAVMRILFSAIAYNTQLVKPEDAPKSYADLLHPKWMGKLVKAHPGYSGAIMTATHAMVRELGWGYFEKLATQKVLQVQSGVDPPKKIALGERAVMADGSDYNVVMHKAAGAPVELVYPLEGAPVINSPNGIFKAAPNPNAARLFMLWSYSAEGQQRFVDYTSQYSAHRQAKAKPGRPALASIKVMKDDLEGILASADEIKKRYLQIFKV